MRKQLLVLALALFALPGLASGPPMEASGLVTGSITVNPDGSVKSFTLDWRDELPAGVVALIEKNVSQWKFQPVVSEGAPVNVRGRMSIRVATQPTPLLGVYAIGVQSVAFIKGDVGGSGHRPDGESGQPITPKSGNQLPLYPKDLPLGVEGWVYLVQDIGRDGRVRRQAVRQVNLRQRLRGASTAVDAAWRAAFAEVVLRVGLNWTYSYPTAGENAKSEHMIVVVPVMFRMPYQARRKHHWKWEGYFAGPKQEIPWADNEQSKIADTDALPDEGIFVADTRFKLLTPIGPSGPQLPADKGPNQG